MAGGRVIVLWLQGVSLGLCLFSLLVFCVLKMPCPVAQTEAHATRALTSDWLTGWLNMTPGGAWLSDELPVPLTIGPGLAPSLHQEPHLGKGTPHRVSSAPQS